MSLFSGEITFELRGRNISRFISHCNSSGITFRSVVSHSIAQVTVTVPVRDAKPMLREAGRCRLRVKTVKRVGFLLHIKAANRRFVLLYGGLIVAVVLFVLSHFVWTIEVKGLYRTDPAHMSNLLADVGIHRFMFIDKEQINDLARELSASDIDIAKVTIHMSGVKMTVTVNETIAEDEISVSGDYCNIYATKSGVVEQITVRTGRAVVKKGDVVQKGDLLISGDLSVEDKSIFVAADGEVTARVGYSFSAEAGQLLPARVRSGETHNANAVSMLGREFIKAGYDEYEFEEKSGYMDCSILFPMYVREVEAAEMTDGYAKATPEEQKSYAESRAYAYMTDSINKNAVIVSKHTSYEEGENGGITARISIIAIEDITVKGE